MLYNKNHKNKYDLRRGSNTSYVCFDCRSVSRNGGGHCRFCSKPLTMLFVYVEVPKKSKDRDWKKLFKRINRIN